MATPATTSLITTSAAYCEAKGLSRSRVSTLVFNDGKALARIAAGGDLNTRSFEKAMLWFAFNWPDATPWPEGVERPEYGDSESAPSMQGAA